MTIKDRSRYVTLNPRSPSTSTSTSNDKDKRCHEQVTDMVAWEVPVESYLSTWTSEPKTRQIQTDRRCLRQVASVRLSMLYQRHSEVCMFSCCWYDSALLSWCPINRLIISQLKCGQHLCCSSTEWYLCCTLLPRFEEYLVSQWR